MGGLVVVFAVLGKENGKSNFGGEKEKMSTEILFHEQVEAAPCRGRS